MSAPYIQVKSSRDKTGQDKTMAPPPTTSSNPPPPLSSSQILLPHRHPQQQQQQQSQTPTPSSPAVHHHHSHHHSTAAATGPRPSEDDSRRRVSRKLQKRRHGAHTPTMELPDRLKETVSDAEQEEDVFPAAQRGGGMFMNMNQSIFGLIAAAGSTVDFNHRLEGNSSDEEDDEGEDEDNLRRARRGKAAAVMEGDGVAQTAVLRKPSGKGEKHHRRKFSDSKLLRSLPTLSRLSTKGKAKKLEGRKPTVQIQEESEPESSATDSPTIGIPDENRLAPVMSRMLEARAEATSRPSFDLERLSGERGRIGGIGDTGPTDLSKRLMEIFQFEEPEEVVSEYPCWLLQSVLLQGYIYITSKHICFYSYLPKKSHEVAKSGYLSKSGKRNPKYNRYWFRLKGDVLSYYRDASNLYFPSGQIDLRYGISASITDKDKDGVHFAVVTDHRTYNFRADSAPSAKEWVKSLQRVIFRSHNDGDSVKISLPIQNIIDIEETQMLEFADTCKIRVIDNDETYAIDEYFFSFFSYGKEALNVLKILIEDSTQQSDSNKVDARVAAEEASTSEIPSSKRTSMSGSRDKLVPPKIRTTKLNDNVKATLSPMSPQSPPGPSPRPSGEYTRGSFDAFRQFGRKSLDLARVGRPEAPRRSVSDSRRSFSGNRLAEMSKHPERYGSSDSYVQSMEDPSQASISQLMASSSDADQSASQILRGSDVFHSPTIRRSASATRRRPQEHHHHRGSPSPKPRGHGSPHLPRHAATTGHLVDPGAGEDLQSGTPTLQSFAKMGSYPLQRVGEMAGFVNRHTKRMSTFLSTEPMGYVEKISGMWKGGHKHYDENAGLRTDDELGDDDTKTKEDKTAIANDRFREHFALPETEKLTATYFGYLIRVLPLYGKVYLSERFFCFRSLLPGTRTKLILPLKDIENVDKEKGFRFGYSGLVVVIRGHEELFFEFGQANLRDDCAITLLQGLEASRFMRESHVIDQDEQESADNALAERDALQEARHEEYPDHELQMPRQTTEIADCPTILFDDPKASILNFKPEKSLRITCLTIGSRGDVQPYIALCKGLLAEGHKPRIATHIEFKDWIEKHGIEFAVVEGDPAELMRLVIQNGTFTLAFLREANSTMRKWLDGLLLSSWEACRDSDVLIESPSAMAGIHIAEKLGIPYFRAFGMPWTRTRAYPHAFVMPEHKMGGAYNYVTYVMFDNVFWKATAGQVNRWRNKTLGLPNTNLERMQPNKVPFLYNFSPFVVPPPLDYSDWIRVTGYWFLDEGGQQWTPPKDLVDFIDKARKDEKKLVYVGFGSIILDNPGKFTREIIDAVMKADVRCILSKGWSDRLDPKASGSSAEDSEKTDSEATEIPLPPEIFSIKSAPHDWLFGQIDAAAHHGGSGTTGASLRAGIPTIVRPFFGDQFFFGSRVEDLGVGICLRKWGSNSFARALWEATHSERMINKAKMLGENIRKENGIDTAIQCIYRDMEYAKSLVIKKAGKNAAAAAATDSEDFDDAEEESWTFVGDGDGSDELAAEAAVAGVAGGSLSMGSKALGSRIMGSRAGQ